MTTVPSIAVLLASLTLQGEPPAALPGESLAPQPARYSLYWGDVDGDALEDALAVDLDGRAALLLNRGDGSFEDATLAAGLAELEGVTLAAFADFDGDGRADLFVGGLAGRGRLFRNGEGAIFERTDSGLDHAELDLAARAIDFDADGQLDLQIETQAGELLYRNLGRARFERVELPLAPTAAPGLTLGPSTGDDSAQQATAAALARARRILERARSQRSSSSSLSAGPTGSTPTNANELPDIPGVSGTMLACRPMITDQATGNCLFASSTPSLGNLYPLSTAFNVDSNGRVGIGTSTQSARLHVVFSGAGEAVNLPGLRLSTTSGAPNVLGGAANNSVGGSVTGGTIAGGEGHSVSGPHGAIGGGFTNIAGQQAAVAGGIYNSATGFRSFIGGGYDNSAQGAHSVVGGGYDNNLVGTYGVIGGGEFNNVNNLATHATIGGGKDNQVFANFGTIGGGGPYAPGAFPGNRVYDGHGVVGGGSGNTAGTDDGDPSLQPFATVAGGSTNRATAYCSTVGGGLENIADGARELCVIE